jgi:hypothetical protein
MSVDERANHVWVAFLFPRLNRSRALFRVHPLQTGFCDKNPDVAAKNNTEATQNIVRAAEKLAKQSVTSSSWTCLSYE